MRRLFWLIAFLAGSVFAQDTEVLPFTGLYAKVGQAPEARKVCNKGKPCGNTCININHTCHIGTNPNPYPPYVPPVTNPVIPPVTPVTPAPPAVPEVAVKPTPASCVAATVERIVDGDTLVVRGPNGAEKVRIGQIDAPERSQQFGQQATACLSNMVQHRAIQMCSDGKDRYGRTVANISVDGRDVGEMMVANGCAWAYSKYLEAGSWLPQLQAQAQARGNGLWAGQAMAPWEYRGGSAPVPVTPSGTTPVTVTATTLAPTVERILDWAEAEFSDALQGGSESVHTAAGAYRCYASSMCVGVMNGRTVLFDATQIVDVGLPQLYLDQAAAAGY